MAHGYRRRAGTLADGALGQRVDREVTDTPVGAMLYRAGNIPLAERAAVCAAMPLLIIDDFAEAARLVREAGAAPVLARGPTVPV
jgi:hypothetical protein